MKKTILTILASAVLSLALVGSGTGAMITGSIIIGGQFNPLTQLIGGTTTGLIDAKAIDFFGDTGTVNGVDGDFTGLSGPVAMTDFQFDPLGYENPAGILSLGTVPDLWEIDGFAFALESVTIALPRTATALSLTGLGTISKSGFDDTIGRWSLSGDTSGTVFGWSSTTTPVPEPATMLLFGTGLVGLAGLGRRKLRKK